MGFEPVTLEQMENVKLLDRMDVKYVIPENKLDTILQNLKKDYRVLQIEGQRYSDYRTLYFDTADFKLYRMHHSGMLNRYKVRHRTYVDSNLAFLEVKFKNNKGRTVKDRRKMLTVPLIWDTDSSHFIHSKTPYHADTLLPSVWVNYRRITLVGKLNCERVTIDLDLEFVTNEARKKMDRLVIIEVKQPGRIRTPVLKELRINKCREGSISKYCLAVVQMYPMVKKNNFKEKISILNKLTHDNTSDSAANR